MTIVTLETQRLTKRFGDRTAVSELSFAAAQGEIIGLLGPNGAGKTTTIRLLTTVIAPTSGHFSVAGVSCNRPQEIRKQIGVLPESAGYPRQQTARQYLSYHARLFGMARAEAAEVADRLLDEVDLAARGSSRIATFSRGMRQRLGIARALVNDPVVVFLDEPTLGLDPAGQRKVLSILADIAARRAATVVLSTHTLSEVEEICSRVLILDNGRALTCGTVSEITRTVASRRSGRLLVPAELSERANQVLSGVDGLTVERSGDRLGLFTLGTVEASDEATVEASDEATVEASDEATVEARVEASDEGLNAALTAVLRADVPVLSFEVDGARLRDAFLSLTAAGAAS